MHTQPITHETLARSVIAVPPLARNDDLSLNPQENTKLIQYLEQGGVTNLLYGGNAVLHHIAVSEYGELLSFLAEAADEQTWVIPSLGPAFGMMMDQAAILREFPFPTAMVLPQRDVCTSDGVATGIRRVVELLERPVVLYIKHDGFIEIDAVRQLMDDGLLSWIKYAIVRGETSKDEYLRQLVDAVGSSRVVSGIGEQPAIVHLREFGLTSFTSGCVCVAPSLSMEMLQAVRAGEFEAAERIRGVFRPLEDLRNAVSPVRVLHAAVTLTGIADMGPIQPLLSEVDSNQSVAVQSAAAGLLKAEDVFTHIA